MKAYDSTLLLLRNALSRAIRIAILAIPLLRPNAPKRNALLGMTYLLLAVLLFGSVLL